MNDRSRIAFLAVSIVFFVDIFSPAVINAQNQVDLLNRIDRHYKELKSIKSGIKMDKYNSQLDEHDIYAGNLLLLPKQPGRQLYARIDWVTPRVENIAIIGDKFQLYIPKTGQAFTGKADKKQANAPKGAFDFLGMSKADLKANYEPPNVGGTYKIEGGVETALLILKPKKAGAYKQAELWVDKDGMIRMAKITETNNDTTTVLLHGIDRNAAIDASAFLIKFPKGVKPKQV